MDNLRVDHLIYTTPDLATGIEAVRTLLGVEPVPGGHHPDLGTRNALVGLGRSVYLEILGPDPESLPPDRGWLFRIDELERPRLATWAVRGSMLDPIVAAAREAGIDLGSVQKGSRRQPDGSVLSWTLTDPYALREGGVLPFLIDWGRSPHPATALPSGCELLALRLLHPEAHRVRSALEALGVDVEVEQERSPGLAATIRGPNGTVELR